MGSHRHACFAEAFGTFCLVFAGTGAVVVDAMSGGTVSHLGIALCFGLVVMVMIYAVGEVSGAHLNPAVTVAFALAKRFDWRRVPGFILAQCLGAIVASVAVRFLIGDAAELGNTVAQAGWDGLARTMSLELIFSWMLMLVILGVSTGAKEKGLMAGIAIGGTVALLAAFGGPLTGASMNPARSLAPALISGDPLSCLPYLAATPLGTALAVWTLCLIRPADCCPNPDGSSCC